LHRFFNRDCYEINDNRSGGTSEVRYEYDYDYDHYFASGGASFHHNNNQQQHQEYKEKLSV
jgi:hypothetical protein